MVVSGIFADKADVELAVEEMKRDGFRNGDISVLFSYNEDTKAYVLARTTEQSDAATDQGICRAAIGGALGWLAGIDILDIPGLGPFMAAGPIRAFFDDDRNSAVGGLTGSLAGTGIPEDAARIYAVCIRAGYTLLSVHANDFKWIRKAMKIFEQTGAKDIIRTPETEGDCANRGLKQKQNG
jgi:hypothetical protein